MRGGHAIDFVSGGADAHAPVDFLTVHAELLVEDAGVEDRLAADHHRRAKRVIDRKRLPGGVELARIAAIDCGVVQASRDGEQVEYKLRQPWKAECAVLERAVAVCQ